MGLKHKQKIKTDFGPNLPTQVSEYADINLIRSNNLLALIANPWSLCKRLSRAKQGATKPKQQYHSMVESATDVLTQTLKSLLNNQTSNGYNNHSIPIELILLPSKAFSLLVEPGQ